MESQADATRASAGELHALADLLASLTPAALAADHLDQLEALERVKSAAAAAQVVVATAFEDAASGEYVPADGRRRPPRAMSLGAEVALATLASPYAGEQRLLLSRRLRDDLPLTLAALARGELTEDRAFALAREVAHLDPEQRGRVDEDLDGRLAGLGDVQLRQAVRKSCLTHAAEAETERYVRAREDRRVTTRALDDGTGQVTATVTLETLAAVRKELDDAAATARAAGDERTAGQVRADTLVARVLGTNSATASKPATAPRPHPTRRQRRQHRSRQRPRTLRALQLPQGNPRLGPLGRRPRRHPTPRGPRSHRTPPHPQIHRTTHARRGHRRHRLLTRRAHPRPAPHPGLLRTARRLPSKPGGSMSSRNTTSSRSALAAVAAVGAVALGGALAVGPSAQSAIASTTVATCDGRAATITGTAGDDELTGTAGDDVIAGLAGQDTIDGGTGNDVICGDAGADVLAGGDGADRILGGDNGLVPQFEDEPSPYGDTVAPGPGDDYVDLGPNTFAAGDYNTADTLDFSDAAAGVTVDLVAGTAVGEGADVIVVPGPGQPAGPAIELLGSHHSDHILGTEGNDQLVGQGGGDWIEGRGGDDLVMNAWDEYSPAPGENADDHFDGGAGEDFVDSTGGADTLLGGEGADHVRKEGGPTTIDAGTGRDFVELYVSGGSHSIAGGDGRDEVSLGVLNSFGRTRGVFDHRDEVFRVRHHNGRRTRAELVSIQKVQMPHNRGRWTYLGTNRDDVVSGGAPFRALGRGGDDVLKGSYGDDVLLGGRGHDVVRGNRGDDRCRGEEVSGC